MKKILTFALAVSMMASLAVSASALEYSIAPPKDFDFGRDTSIEVIHTADGGAMKNDDMSKNAALIPPTFGSESMNALHTGEYLTPNLAPGGIPASGAVIGGSAATVVTPGSATGVITPSSTVNGGGYQPPRSATPPPLPGARTAARSGRCMILDRRMTLPVSLVLILNRTDAIIPSLTC